MRSAASFGEMRQQLAFLINNYDKLMSIWGDAALPKSEEIPRQLKVLQ